MEPKRVSPAEARVAAAGRVPMGVRRLKLAAPNIQGHFTRWFNDDPPGRINDAQKGGYEFVLENEVVGQVSSNIDTSTADLGERVARVVGTSKTGQPIVAYLMKIKQEWYDADQHAKLEPVRESDRQIREGQIAKQEGDGRYNSGINISRNR